MLSSLTSSICAFCIHELYTFTVSVGRRSDFGRIQLLSFVIRIRVKDGTVGVEKCVRPLGHPQEAEFSKALSEIRISQIPKSLHDLHVDEVRIMAQMHYMTSAYTESLISSGMFQERVSRDLWPATQSSQAAGSAEGGTH